MIIENPSQYSVIALACSLGLFIAWRLIRTCFNSRPLPMVPYYFPFGFDTMYEIVTVSSSPHLSNEQYNNRNANLELWNKWMSITRSTTFKVSPRGKLKD